MDNVQSRQPSNLIPMIMLGMLFFIFGLVSWVNSILIPYFKVSCELTHTQSYLVALAFYIAYLVMSIPAARLIGRVGSKTGYYDRIMADVSRNAHVCSCRLYKSLFYIPDRAVHHRNRAVHTANGSQSLCNHTRPDRIRGTAYQHYGTL